MAHYIRLGAGAIRLVLIEPKEGAHSEVRLLRSTNGATVTRGGLSLKPAGVPAQLQFSDPLGCRHDRSKVLHHQVRIVAQDLPGVQQVVRVEDLLDLLEDPVERAVLPPDESRTGESVAVLTADCPAYGEHNLVKVLRESLDTACILGCRRRQQRTQMQLTGRRMSVKGCRDLVLLKYALGTDQKIVQRFRRNGNVFDKRKGARRTGQSCEKGDHRSGKRPEELDLFERIDLMGHNRIAAKRTDLLDHHPDPIACLRRAKARLFDNQCRLCRRSNHGLEAWIGLAGHRQNTPIQQITGAWLLLSDCLDRINGGLQPPEQQQDDTAMLRQTTGQKRGRREESQGPFGTDKHPSQVDVGFITDPTQMITAAVAKQWRLVFSDQVLVV